MKLSNGEYQSKWEKGLCIGVITSIQQFKVMVVAKEDDSKEPKETKTKEVSTHSIEGKMIELPKISTLLLESTHFE